MSSPRLLAEEIETSPHNDGEKTSNPVLDSVIIAAEAALCNSFVSYYFTLVEKFHYPLVLNLRLRYKELSIRTNVYLCDFLLPPSDTVLLAT
jgi:hypothetical protein